MTIELDDILKVLQSDLDMIQECRKNNDLDAAFYNEEFKYDLHFAERVTHKKFGAHNYRVVVIDAD